MKKTLSILALSALPVLAWAAGGHISGHDAEPTHGHDMSGMSQGDTPVGRPGDASKVSRTVAITMDDTMRFTPAQIDVEPGATVRFLVKNTGKLPHEMVIGSAVDLTEHAAMMRKNAEMQHAEPNMITLAPGQNGAIVWEFSEAGTVDFACLVPGHMEAGMVGRIKVA